MAIPAPATRLSLLGRVLLVVGVTLALTLPIGVFLVVDSQLALYRRATASELAMTLDVLERMVGEQAVIGDYTLIEQILQSRVRHGNFVRISYTDLEGRVLSATAPRPAAHYPSWFGSWFDLSELPVSRAVVIGGQPYGWVTVSVSHTAFRNQVWNAAREQMALFAGIGLVLFVLVAWGLRGGLAPLRELTRLARSLRQGEYQCLAIPPGRTAPEIRETLVTFNDAASREAWLARFAEIVSGIGSTQAKVEAVMQLLCLRLDMDAATFAWMEGDRARVAAKWTRLPEAEGLAWVDFARRVAARNAPLRVGPAAATPPGRGAAPGTYLGVPVTLGSHGTAVFSLFSRERRALADHNGEVELAALCGGWIAATLMEAEQEREILEQKIYAETVLDNVAEGIATLDLEGIILSANPAMERIFGCDSGRLAGQPITLYVPDLHWQSLSTHLALRGEAAGLPDMQWQAYGRRSDGARILLELSARPVRHGEQWLVVAVIRDITERVRAEEALRESEARRRHAQEIARLGSLEWFTRSGRVRCSSELDTIWGLAPGTISDLGELLARVVPEDRERVAAEFEAAHREGRGFTTEFAVAAGAECRHMILHAEAPTPGEKGTRVFAVIQDVTDRKQAEARLKAAMLEKLRAEAHDRAKTLFLANMSHELRTPLNAIIGYSEMLHEEALAEGRALAAEDLKKIHNAGTHLLAMINEVLDLAKIEAGRVALNLDEVRLEPLLQEVMDTVAPLAQKNGNQLIARIAPELPAMHTDATKLRQVLLNLLGNACKFTRDGEVILEAQPESGEGQAWLRFAVRDTGIGMTPEQMDRLFEPFVQADPSIHRQYGGTGLGLAISKHFVTMLGGEIWADSVPGRGSVFTVRLPRRAPRAEPEEVPAPRLVEAPARLRGRSGGERRRTPATVVVLERDGDLRALIERQASGEGFRVLSVARAEQIGAELHALLPAVLVADADMPGLPECVDRLRAEPRTRDVPLVLLAAEEPTALARRLGPAAILRKPVPWPALAEAVKACVRGVPLARAGQAV